MNTIVLMGRLARDPETKLTSTQKGQTKVSRFPLVVKRNRTSKAFVVMITAYGNNAEFVEKYLEKGIKIALSGELVISQIKDEQTGTASYYTEVIMDNVEFAEANGDYLIPNIIIRKTKPLGHYGRLRKAYLEMHRPILFNELVLSDKLFEHCAEIDETARNRMELIVRSLAEQNGVTEQLKAENQMEWVRQMNACKAQAEEIVKAELIYD